MNVPQHYRVTLTQAIAHYQNGDLTAKGLLHFYFRIRLAKGWEIKETQKEITEKLGISRAAFYSAVSKLKAEGSINWSTPVDTKFCFSLNYGEFDHHDTDSIIVDSDSTVVDNHSTLIESATVDGDSTVIASQSALKDGQSTLIENPSATVDDSSFVVTNEKSKRKPHKDLRKRPYSSSNSSSDSFSNSSSTLSSNCEREKKASKKRGQEVAEKTRSKSAIAQATELAPAKPNQTLSDATRERNLLLWNNLDDGTRREISYFAYQVAIPKLPIKPTLTDAWIICHCEELGNQMLYDVDFQRKWGEISATAERAKPDIEEPILW